MRTTTLWREQSSKPFWGFLIVSFSGIFFLVGDIVRTSGNLLSLLGGYRLGVNSLMGSVERLAPLSALIGYLIFTLAIHNISRLFTGKAATALQTLTVAGLLFMAGELTGWLIAPDSPATDITTAVAYAAMLLGAVRMRTAPELPAGVRTAGMMLILSALACLAGSLTDLFTPQEFVQALPLRSIGWILGLIGWNLFRLAQPTEGSAAKVHTLCRLDDAPGGLTLKAGFVLTCVLFVAEQFYLPIVDLLANEGKSLYAAGSPEEKAYIAYAYPYFLLAQAPLLLYAVAWVRQLQHPGVRLPAALVSLYVLLTLGVNVYAHLHTLSEGQITSPGLTLFLPLQLLLLVTGGLSLIWIRKHNCKLAQGGWCLLACLLGPLSMASATELTRQGWLSCRGQHVFYMDVWPLIVLLTAFLFFYGSRSVFVAAVQLNRPQTSDFPA